MINEQNREKEKCYSCGGKGTYSQIHGQEGFDDFGGEGFFEAPTIHNYPCKACNGTGLKLSNPEEIQMPDWKKNSVGGDCTCSKCSVPQESTEKKCKCTEYFTCPKHYPPAGNIHKPVDTPKIDWWEEELDELNDSKNNKEIFSISTKSLKSFIHSVHDRAYEEGFDAGGHTVGGTGRTMYEAGVRETVEKTLDFDELFFVGDVTKSQEEYHDREVLNDYKKILRNKLLSLIPNEKQE